MTVSIPASSTGNAPTLIATGLGGVAEGSRTGNGEITLIDPPVVTITGRTDSMAEGSNLDRRRKHHFGTGSVAAFERASVGRAECGLHHE